MDKSIQHSIIFYNAGIVHTSDVIDIFLEWTKFSYEWFFENETAAPINQRDYVHFNVSGKFKVFHYGNFK